MSLSPMGTPPSGPGSPPPPRGHRRRRPGAAPPRRRPAGRRRGRIEVAMRSRYPPTRSRAFTAPADRGGESGDGRAPQRARSRRRPSAPAAGRRRIIRGTWKKLPSRAGALASASSTESIGPGRSSRIGQSKGTAWVMGSTALVSSCRSSSMWPRMASSSASAGRPPPRPAAAAPAGRSPGLPWHLFATWDGRGFYQKPPCAHARAAATPGPTGASSGNIRGDGFN